MPTRTRTSRFQYVALIIVALLGANAHAAPAAKPELPAAATILDPDIYFYGWPYPAISPDGNWVAYVSNGYVCVCNINAPAPRRIMEVPNSYTWPRFQVGSGDAVKTGPFDALSHGLERDEYNKLHEQVTNTVYGLNWTFDSKGFVFGVQKYDRNKKMSTYDGYVASTEGTATKLTHIDPDSQIRGIVAGILTRNRKFLVSTTSSASSDRYRPVIWNVAENKPRATPFLSLIASQTSGRWIGIEKDTKQLVIIDEGFEVKKRFDATMPNRSFGLRIDWSPDERFIIWRNAIGFDHFSNWEGFRMDLDTGEKRKLEGRFMDEQFGFTCRSGEFYRCGQTGMKTNGYDAVVGAHLTLIPDGNGPETDLWRIKVGLNGARPGMLTNGPGEPIVRVSPDGNLFVIAISRPAGERSGGVWHMLNRDGNKWRFPGRDNGDYISPYEVAGFADNGRKIVAYDSKRLFALPVSAVMIDQNEAK